MAAPLAALLKREAFSWTDEAEAAFLQLKAPLVSAPLLQLPDFSKRLLSIVMLQELDLAQYFIREMAPWLSSVEQWQLIMPSYQLMRGSSSAW